MAGEKVCAIGNVPARVPRSETVKEVFIRSLSTYVQNGTTLSRNLTNQEWHAIGRRLQLSRRQLQIVQCVFDALAESAIARRLEISPHTVHSHLNRLYDKLGVASRCELIVQVFIAYLSLTSATKGDYRKQGIAV